jgi:hypothetical protein
VRQHTADRACGDSRECFQDGTAGNLRHCRSGETGDVVGDSDCQDR